MFEIREFLANETQDASASWSIGALGVIAEFSRSPGEPVNITGCTAITNRGGLQLDLTGDITPIAYEVPGVARNSWHHGVALCLPEAAARWPSRTTIAELGPDRGALRTQDKSATLFDLGIDTPYCRVCVRTDDPAVLKHLRVGIGKSLLDPASGLFKQITETSPHRVFISRLGRLEVYQRIGDHRLGTPEGPHTHLIPKILSRRRAYPANIPVPQGWVPSAMLYPSHPAYDLLGRSISFDEGAYQRFQEIFRHFGDHRAVNAKHAIMAALSEGTTLRSAETYSSRIARLATRVALRQHACRGLNGSETW